MNFIFPPICNLCQTQIDQPSALCAKCWGKLHFITKPYCSGCGYPFEAYPSIEGVAHDHILCGKCLAAPKPYKMARAIMAYDQISRLLILPYKHLDRGELTPLFSQWLRTAEPSLFENIDLIIPVPLHYRRLLMRKYNQAALLANHLARFMEKPVLADLLIRTHQTHSQGGLTAKQRFQNVSKSFAVNPRHLQKIAGKNILLIDDVQTTGATLDACSKALLSAGGNKIHVLTLARVLRPSRVK